MNRYSLISWAQKDLTGYILSFPPSVGVWKKSHGIWPQIPIEGWDCEVWHGLFSVPLSLACLTKVTYWQFMFNNQVTIFIKHFTYQMLQLSLGRGRSNLQTLTSQQPLHNVKGVNSGNYLYTSCTINLLNFYVWFNLNWCLFNWILLDVDIQWDGWCQFEWKKLTQILMPFWPLKSPMKIAIICLIMTISIMEIKIGASQLCFGASLKLEGWPGAKKCCFWTCQLKRNTLYASHRPVQSIKISIIDTYSE